MLAAACRTGVRVGCGSMRVGGSVGGGCGCVRCVGGKAAVKARAGAAGFSIVSPVVGRCGQLEEAVGGWFFAAGVKAPTPFVLTYICFTNMYAHRAYAPPPAQACRVFAWLWTQQRGVACPLHTSVACLHGSRARAQRKADPRA
eukprot:361172-Chlamydomonas_euryale.AAC.1